ncbi:hypothetical protein [Rossellomorea marisflavi]|uniref:hypothetical protein n=1 Tax=Rossellomorea marisflavi TaxID=189381 RepID=UPI00295EDB36|nr:hypothetical protein [Rossellomorea marisflavi]
MIDDLKEMLTFKPDEHCNGTEFYHLSVNEIKGIVEMLEQADGFERLAKDMVEKHILFDSFQTNTLPVVKNTRTEHQISVELLVTQYVIRNREDEISQYKEKESLLKKELEEVKNSTH